MSTNTRRMLCSADDVFEVIADGWTYPAWVVGASRMRQVGANWPRVGEHIRHSFGPWPLVIDDRTTVLEWDPPRRVVLRAQGWPLGEAIIEIDAQPRGEHCVVRMREWASAGPASWLPNALLDIPLSIRNRETLQRLALIAEGHAGPDHDQSAAEGDDA
ncbi:MAG: SRPBCC family protein [Microbacteriaceae bacterium]